MLSGKLPTGTVSAGAETEPRGSARGAATRRPVGSDGRNARNERPRERTERTERTERPERPDGTCAAAATRTAAGDRRIEAERRGELERRLSVERARRRATVDRYERVLAARRASGDDGEDGATSASVDVGDLRSWIRRACCRVRLRLSRRG